MSTLRWAIVTAAGAVGLAWAAYLTYLITASTSGVELARSPLRSYLLACLVTAALVVTFLGAAVAAVARVRDHLTTCLRAHLPEVRTPPHESAAPGAPTPRRDGLTPAYLDDAAELFELGRASERQRRELG